MQAECMHCGNTTRSYASFRVFFTEEGIASAFLGRGFVWYVLVRGSDT